MRFSKSSPKLTLWQSNIKINSKHRFNSFITSFVALAGMCVTHRSKCLSTPDPTESLSCLRRANKLYIAYEQTRWSHMTAIKLQQSINIVSLKLYIRAHTHFNRFSFICMLVSKLVFMFPMEGKTLSKACGKVWKSSFDMSKGKL